VTLSTSPAVGDTAYQRRSADVPSEEVLSQEVHMVDVRRTAAQFGRWTAVFRPQHAARRRPFDEKGGAIESMADVAPGTASCRLCDFAHYGQAWKNWDFERDG